MPPKRRSFFRRFLWFLPLFGLLLFRFRAGDGRFGFRCDRWGERGGEQAGEGRWWQVHFTDPEDERAGEAILSLLLDRIEGAQETIDIAAFEFDLPRVAEALIAARRRGVTIRWVTDDVHGILADRQAPDPLFPRLQEAGVAIRDDGRAGLMHDKFLVFDGKAVWTGSLNLTRRGLFRNDNNVVLLDAKEVAEIFTREFTELWEGMSGPASPSTLALQRVVVEGSEVFVLFGPEDDVAAHLAAEIETAAGTIRFMAFSFTHDGIGDAVLDRAKGGVAVRGIFEKRGAYSRYSELRRFHCAGLPVRIDTNPGTFHHKVFLLDEGTV
ncbi:MAG: hypothetical protein D6795_11720, partial [Deltaproteobacteria bacterium]